MSVSVALSYGGNQTHSCSPKVLNSSSATRSRLAGERDVRNWTSLKTAGCIRVPKRLLSIAVSELGRVGVECLDGI